MIFSRRDERICAQIQSKIKYFRLYYRKTNESQPFRGCEGI